MMKQNHRIIEWEVQALVARTINEALAGVLGTGWRCFLCAWCLTLCSSPLAPSGRCFREGRQPFPAGVGQVS